MKHFALIALVVAIIGVAIYAVVTQLSGSIKLNNVVSPSLFDYSILPATSTSGGSGTVSPSAPSSGSAPSSAEPQQPQIRCLTPAGVEPAFPT